VERREQVVVDDTIRLYSSGRIDSLPRDIFMAGAALVPTLNLTSSGIPKRVMMASIEEGC
jgi:hypothetical protein